MSIPFGDKEPLDLGDTPAQEGVSEADAADRVDLDPDAQPNFTDVHPEAQDNPPTS